jgi:hypothetical protein
LTSYDDLVQPLAGKAGEGSGLGNCYASNVIDQPRQQAWATMSELLAQNGWQVSTGGDENAYVGARFRKDSVLMSVTDSGESVPQPKWAEPALSLPDGRFRSVILRSAAWGGPSRVRVGGGCEEGCDGGPECVGFFDERVVAAAVEDDEPGAGDVGGQLE